MLIVNTKAKVHHENEEMIMIANHLFSDETPRRRI